MSVLVHMFIVEVAGTSKLHPCCLPVLPAAAYWIATALSTNTPTTGAFAAAVACYCCCGCRSISVAAGVCVGACILLVHAAAVFGQPALLIDEVHNMRNRVHTKLRAWHPTCNRPEAACCWASWCCLV